MGSTTGRRGRSQLAAIPTTLPAADDAPVTLFAAADVASRRDRQPAELLPGAVHVPDWLDVDAQRSLVDAFRQWAEPPAGLRHPRVPAGHVMGVQSVCLGWHWYPYQYSRTADDTDGAPVKPIPPDVRALAREAVAAAYGDAGGFEPDAVIANYYTPSTKLGLHTDGEEPSNSPVVTISIGDACVFRFAGVDRRTAPFVDVWLASGDLLVFGGPTRRIYHGVPKVIGGTAPAGLGLPAGRLSITIRETGL
jgi:alkylated DNA repair protein (DNA oxidative demethylase)